MEQPDNRAYETHAYVLAVIPPKTFLREGRGSSGSTVQSIGEDNFTLLELVPKRGAKLRPQDRVVIERDARGQIDHVKRRISYDDLAPESSAELPLVIEIIVTKHETRFVKFFNEAPPITTRMHSLQLLPGIGQTLMWALLEERKKGKFKSFDDIASRTKLQNPKKVVTGRIVDELKGDVKRWLFVKPPITDSDRPRHSGR